MAEQKHVHGPSCGCAEEAKGLGDLESLFPVIDVDKIVCYNESVSGSGAKVFKPYDKVKTPARRSLLRTPRPPRVVFVGVLRSTSMIVASFRSGSTTQTSSKARRRAVRC
jgi:hypothetical protein